MKRWTGCLLVLCLGCSKSDAEKSAPSAPAAPTQAQASTDESGDQEAKAIASLRSDPGGKVKAYLVWHQHYLDMLQQIGERGKAYEAQEKAGKSEGFAGTARGLAAIHAAGKDVQDRLDKAKAESGLSGAELNALNELMANAQMREQMQKGAADMKGANADEQIAKFEQLVASAPAEAQEEMKKQIAEMKEAQVKLQESIALKEMRAKYGDPVVEAMLSTLPALNAQLKKYQAATK
jgi:hypothetical protein